MNEFEEPESPSKVKRFFRFYARTIILMIFFFTIMLYLENSDEFEINRFGAGIFMAVVAALTWPIQFIFIMSDGNSTYLLMYFVVLVFSILYPRIKKVIISLLSSQ